MLPAASAVVEVSEFSDLYFELVDLVAIDLDGLLGIAVEVGLLDESDLID